MVVDEVLTMVEVPVAADAWAMPPTSSRARWRWLRRPAPPSARPPALHLGAHVVGAGTRKGARNMPSPSVTYGRPNAGDGHGRAWQSETLAVSQLARQRAGGFLRRAGAAPGQARVT